MTSEPQEELLSAYLDNELSASERAQVEKWLAESAEYRQLYDDLRAVRQDLALLPRHKLAEDLGPAVLRRAERDVLLGRKPAPPADNMPRSAISRWWSEGRSRRMLIWPAVAMAAALLIAVFETRRDGGEREVARQTTDDVRLREDLGAAASVEAAPREAEAVGAVSEFSRSASPAMKAAGSPPASTDADAEVDRKEGPRDAHVLSLQPGAAPAATGNFDLLKMESNVRRALENREQVNLIQCDVSPDFINENRIEKVFAGNKIDFIRLDAPLAADEKDLPAKTQDKLRQEVGRQYTVQATPKQIEQIVTELEQDRRRVSNLALGLQDRGLGQDVARAKQPAQEPLKPNMAGAAAQRSSPRGGEANQQPVIIWLRQAVDEKPPEPAKP